MQLALFSYLFPFCNVFASLICWPICLMSLVITSWVIAGNNESISITSLSPFAHPLETRPFRTTLPQLSASFSWQGNINFNCGSFSIQWEMLIQFSNSKRVALRHYSFATPSAPVSRCGGYLRSICLARRASERCLFAYQLADSSHSCSSYNYKYT